MPTGTFPCRFLLVALALCLPLQACGRIGGEHLFYGKYAVINTSSPDFPYPPNADYYRNPTDNDTTYTPPKTPVPPDRRAHPELDPRYANPTDNDTDYVAPRHLEEYYPLVPLEPQKKGFLKKAGGGKKNDYTRGVYESFPTDNVIPYQDNDATYSPYYDN